MIKNIGYMFIFLMSISIYSQREKLNNYKYIIVPEKFDFLKSNDQYKTSSLTKFLLEKKGFKVFMANENFPADLASDRCLAAFAKVLNTSGMLTTKMQVEFKDCNEKVIYTTNVGKSKYKDYRRAYSYSIRKAVNSFDNFNYKYVPLNVQKVISKKDEVVEKKITKIIKTPEPKKQIIKEKTITTNLLYAQPKENGFQLVNLKPEVVFIVLKTNLKNVFIIKDKNGIFHKIGGKWFAEYYNEGVLVQKEYQVKF